MFSAIGHCMRLAWAGYVLAHEGVFARIDATLLPPPMRLPLAAAKLVARRGAHTGPSRLALAIARLGPS